MNLPIKTQRLFITMFDESMAESVHQNSIDDDNRRFLPDEVFETVEAARETITALTRFYLQNSVPLVFPVCLSDGRQIGHVQAVPIERGWEVGYHIGKAYTGKGYATEAVGAFLAPVMTRLGISRVFALCRVDNVASRRVLEKCGFTMNCLEAGGNRGETRDICRYSYTIG